MLALRYDLSKSVVIETVTPFAKRIERGVRIARIVGPLVRCINSASW